MKSLKELLAQSQITVAGTGELRIFCDDNAEKQQLFDKLSGIAAGDTSHTEDSITQVLVVKAVLVYDDDGNYFIHGTSRDGADVMFKSMAGIWNFDPSKEVAQQVELELEVSRAGSIMKPKVL